MQHRRRSGRAAPRPERRAVQLLIAAALAAAVVAGALVSVAPPAAAAAAPYTTAWSAGVGDVYLASPAIADVNGDGVKDVVQSDMAGMLHVLDGRNGSPLPGWPRPILVRGRQVPSDSTPVVGDIDNDGILEIAVGGVSIWPGPEPHPGGFVVYDARGNWRFGYESGDKGNVFTGGAPDGLGDGVISSPAIGDVNGDGRDDLVVASWDNRVTAYDGAGRVLPGWPFDTHDTVWSSPALYDADDDGAKEVYVGSDANGRYGCYGGLFFRLDRGVPRWHRCIGQILQSSPAIADVDGDGRMEAVFATGKYARDLAHPDTRRIFALHLDDGSPVPGWPVETNGPALTGSVAVGDITGDGSLEVVFGACAGCFGDAASGHQWGRVYAFRGTGGAPLWQREVDRTELISSPVIFDADGDGDNDVVIGYSGKLEVLDGRTGARRYDPLLGGRRILNSPAVADMGGGLGHRLVVTSSVPGGPGRIDALRTPQPGVPSPWPMFRRTADHHGVLPPPPPPPPTAGYWLVASDGGIFPFGTAPGLGSTGGMRLNHPIVGMAATRSRLGYWLVAGDGGIFPFGDAPGLGSTGHMRLNQPIVGMAATPSGKGYWLVASDGGIFPFGDAPGLGSTGHMRLNQPIVGMAATPSGKGYWLVASDGGIFPFGDAPGYGSTGGIRLNQPIVEIVRTERGDGYWLVAADGGIFPFGRAHGWGGTANRRLNRPIVGAAASLEL